MSTPLRGPHHCIGTTCAVTDLIFRYLDDCCAARGDSLSSADLKALHLRLVDSFISSNLEWVETVHRQCMLASGASTPPVLERETALSSLLRLRSDEAARRAFSAQVRCCGPQWLCGFYDALADYIRRHVCVGIDGRLFSAYVKLAARLGAHLSTSDLRKDDPINFLLCQSIVLLTASGTTESLAKALADEINRFGAQAEAGEPGGRRAIEPSEMSLFLLLVRQEFGLPRNRHEQTDSTAAPSLSGSRPDLGWAETDLPLVSSAG